METKKVQKIGSNHSYAVNNCEIAVKNLRKSFEISKIGGKLLQNQRHRFHLNAKNQQQQIEWYLSKNIMFQHPRRRKFYQKRMHQGHKTQANLPKMPYFTDICRNVDRNSVQNCQFMLKSSSATMWYI